MIRPEPRNQNFTAMPLGAKLDKNLLAYAAAASAAGVGMLALVQPAEAKIVYTPAHVAISPNSLIPLDLNHDGINDFSFRNFYSFDGNSGGGTLEIMPAQSPNQAWVSAGGYAAALRGGVRVGPRRPFAAGTKPMARVFVTPSSTPNTRGYGPWQNATKRYLALKFIIRGKTHFGWARLNVKAQAGGVVATLTGYAYETVPNRPIITGKTRGLNKISSARFSTTLHRPGDPQRASLGLLARGAQNLQVERREEVSAE